MLVPELDRVIYHLVSDLAERGLLDDTLVIAMGEFGRTPWLNEARGRDHYPNAWSMALAGCGIQPGAIYGATDENGVDVAEDPVDQRRLFATIFAALGLDPHVNMTCRTCQRFIASRIRQNQSKKCLLRSSHGNHDQEHPLALTSYFCIIRGARR